MPPDALTIDQIIHRLSMVGETPTQETLIWERDRPPRPAAVLLPLFRRREHWHLLYIRRAENTADRHSGEVAFPGGRPEPDDPHATATALREAREEIGLSPARVRVLGRLPLFRTSSNFLVTPVVGLIPWPVELRPDPSEVARIFSLPLGWLADPRNHQVRAWRPPGRNGSHPVVFFREREGEQLWGVSARITLSLVKSLGL
jgi:8-oxo-dGTP pyrophosphatase MutT (NUDIX family)